VVGFLFSEKKRRSLLTQEFVERARCVAHRAPAAASAPRRRRLARSHAGTAHLRGWGAGVRWKVWGAFVTLVPPHTAPLQPARPAVRAGGPAAATWGAGARHTRL